MIIVEESTTNFYFWIEHVYLKTFTIKVNTKFLFKHQKYLSP